MAKVLVLVSALASAVSEESCLIQVERSRSPAEYVATMTPAVYEELRHRTNPAQKDEEQPCGPPIHGQKMYFAGPGRCSIASADMIYALPNGTMRHAVKGKQILMTCDDVMCPIPVIADCYMSPDICGKDEWCWIHQHEKWGAWAMGRLMNGTYGHSPEPDYCNDTFLAAYEMALAKAQQMNDQPKILALNRSRDLLCPSSSVIFSKNAWRPIRGQCVKYRQEQQSCYQEQDLSPSFTGYLKPRYKYDRQGFPMDRPLACAPHLACTAPNFNVLPSTCVQKRPRDICFYGPWWDSSDCPRAHMSSPGLSYEITVNASVSAAMLFPGEVAWPGTCEYWDRTTAIGQDAIRVRAQVYQIMVDLWPYQLFPEGPPSLQALQAMLPDPFEYLLKQGWTPKQASERCMQQANVSQSEVAKLLATAAHWALQPNKVWSLVHFFTFNLGEICETKSQASKALASLLAQNFWCNDCRSFFEVGVVEQFGLPEGNAEAHARWWHHAHNVASEHVATTRAGHPWIHQLDTLPEYQNPFYMSYEDAYQMWHVDIKPWRPSLSRRERQEVRVQRRERREARRFETQ